MSEQKLTADQKIGLGISSTPPSIGPGSRQGSIFLRNGPGALHNTQGMTMAQIDGLVDQWNAMPDSQKAGMVLIA